MNQHKKLICLSYDLVNFLIPEEQVFTASCCDDSSFVTDANGQKIKIKFSDRELNYVNFDECIPLFNTKCSANSVKTSIVIKNKNLFPEEEFFSVLTSTDCHVIVPTEESSLNLCTLPDPYKKMLLNLGIEACCIKDKTINYMLDINKFLGKIYANSSNCR